MLNRRSLLKTIAALPPALALEAEMVMAQAQGAKPIQQITTPILKPHIPMGIAYNDYHTQTHPHDSQYHQTIVKYFTEITDGNATGMNNNQHNQGQYNFSRVDKYVDFGRRNNLKMKGGNLIWGGSSPKWVTNITSPIELEKIMRGYVDLMVKR